LTQIYEGMFLLDNDLVRAGWADAKRVVTDLLGKHGGEVHTARRWAERKLAYPVRRKRRATYLLCHYSIPSARIVDLRRDLDISEQVLRYLFLAVDAVPDTERELAAAEESSAFVVPEPPSDDTPDVELSRGSYDEDEEFETDVETVAVAAGSDGEED